MNGTNVDYYVAGFDTNGKRVGSLICDFNPEKAKNVDKLAALKERAAGLFTNAATIEVIGAEDFNKYLEGYVRGSDGKPVEYVAPEPTDEEKKVAQKAELASEFTSGKEELLDALHTAQLNGDTEAVTSVQEEYKEFVAAYKEAVEGVDA